MASGHYCKQKAGAPRPASAIRGPRRRGAWNAVPPAWQRRAAQRLSARLPGRRHPLRPAGLPPFEPQESIPQTG